MPTQDENLFDHINDYMLGNKSHIIDIDTDEPASNRFQLDKRKKIIIASIVVLITVAAGIAVFNKPHRNEVINPQLDAILNKDLTEAIGTPINQSGVQQTPEMVELTTIKPGSGQIITEHQAAQASLPPVELVVQPVVKQPIAEQPIIEKQKPFVKPLPIVAVPAKEPVQVVKQKPVETSFVNTDDKDKTIEELKTELKRIKSMLKNSGSKRKTERAVMMKEFGITAITKNSIIVTTGDNDEEYVIGDSVPKIGTLVKIDAAAKTIETPRNIYRLK